MAPQMYQIRDTIVNMFLIVEEQGLTLIDTGTAGAAKAVTRTLAKHGFQPADVKTILITHADPDHAGGAAALKALTGAPIYASAGEALALAEGRPPRQPKAGPLGRQLFKLSERLMPITPVSPVQTLADGDVLPILGGLQVLSTPGHTPDHLSFYAPAYGVLFAGDSMISTPAGLRFADGPVTWDYALGCESVRRQAALAPRWVACGHGPVLEGAAVRFPEFAGGVGVS
ncbi:MAG TPA: MBL fold metallo-hydrolase [Roseiflexaceae bacterium]|nr:MBL fold metallo-hydrolase [Roseiflexaceae bacterium]